MQSTKKNKQFMGSFAIIILMFVGFASMAYAKFDEQTGDTASVVVEPEETDEVTAAAVSDNWPQVQYDANRSGYVSQTVGPPYKELWRIGLYSNSGEMPPISSRVQPIIAENLIFMPSNDNSIYAFSTSSGQTVWSYPTNGPLINSAGYANGMVFFGSTDKNIYALKASDGSLVWQFGTGGSIRTAPLLADGKLFIGSTDGSMYALDQNSGALIWETNIGAPIYDTAAYDGGKVFFGGMDSVGYALSASNGGKLWSTPIPGQGFRDRWTVAGNGKVIFTPMLAVSHHKPLAAGTRMFQTSANPTLYDKSWETQRQAILEHLKANSY